MYAKQSVRTPPPPITNIWYSAARCAQSQLKLYVLSLTGPSGTKTTSRDSSVRRYHQQHVARSSTSIFLVSVSHSSASLIRGPGRHPTSSLLPSQVRTPRSATTGVLLAARATLMPSWTDCTATPIVSFFCSEQGAAASRAFSSMSSTPSQDAAGARHSFCHLPERSTPRRSRCCAVVLR